MSMHAGLPLDNPHQIKIVKERPKKDGTDAPTPPLEREITFSPFKLTSLTEKDFEQGNWEGANDIPFDPEHRVKFELPEYWLRKSVPVDVLDPPTPAPKRAAKRKPSGHQSEGTRTLSPTKRTRPNAGTTVKASTASAGPRSKQRQKIPGPEFIDLVSDDEALDQELVFGFTPKPRPVTVVTSGTNYRNSVSGVSHDNLQLSSNTTPTYTLGEGLGIWDTDRSLLSSHRTSLQNTALNGRLDPDYSRKCAIAKLFEKYTAH